MLQIGRSFNRASPAAPPNLHVIVVRSHSHQTHTHSYNADRDASSHSKRKLLGNAFGGFKLARDEHGKLIGTGLGMLHGAGAQDLLVGARVVEAELARLGSLDVALDLFVDGEHHRLTGSHTRHTRRDALPEGTGTLLCKHVLGHLDHTAHRRLALHLGRALDSRLDRVDGCVGEGTERSRDEADQRGFVRGQFGRAVHALCKTLELLVGGKIGRLVGSLTRRRERHTAVQRHESLFADDRVERMCGVTVAGHFQGVSKRVLLRLQSDLDHLHRVDHCHRLRRAGTQTGEEDAACRRLASVLVGERSLVLLETHETDRHLGHDARHHRSQTLVQSERRLALDNVRTRSDESARLLASLLAPARQLHAHLDRVQRCSRPETHSVSHKHRREVNMPKPYLR
ncbi:hypothetical protein L1887_47043 [Cichorium endivia]|nr:hypothetical protein L1887_47043 [Cichorium endivia]